MTDNDKPTLQKVKNNRQQQATSILTKTKEKARLTTKKSMSSRDILNHSCHYAQEIP